MTKRTQKSYSKQDFTLVAAPKSIKSMSSGTVYLKKSCTPASLNKSGAWVAVALKGRVLKTSEGQIKPVWGNILEGSKGHFKVVNDRRSYNLSKGDIFYTKKA